MDQIAELSNIIAKHSNMVFFGGAGVSTECGIPDFRSANGLYSREYSYSFSPEEILSFSFFRTNPGIFYEFLRENILKYDVEPNPGHKALAKLEMLGKLKAVITQNIDSLHQKAGSKNIIELHGSLAKFYCTRCMKEYTREYIMETKDIPRCKCGSIIRPDIVLYEETLDTDSITKSITLIQDAQVLIVAGTSLVVHPAAGLIRYFKGEKTIFINKGKTDYDRLADLVIHEPFGETMKSVMQKLEIWN